MLGMFYNSDPLLTSLDEGVKFLAPERQPQVRQWVGIHHERDPQTAPELINFARVANEVFNMIERPGALEQGAAGERRKGIDTWMGDLRKKLYETRDRMLKRNPQD